jgi:hypothetical protein
MYVGKPMARISDTRVLGIVSYAGLTVQGPRTALQAKYRHSRLEADASIANR